MSTIEQKDNQIEKEKIMEKKKLRKRYKVEFSFVEDGKKINKAVFMERDTPPTKEDFKSSIESLYRGKEIAVERFQEESEEETRIERKKRYEELFFDFECARCGLIFLQLKYFKDLYEAEDNGDPLPSLECPKCKTADKENSMGSAGPGDQWDSIVPGWREKIWEGNQ
ncbi:MAG: hypothetical protein HY445_02845 [Candidatus Niyogibacteria bacterium]|nr:hypothetical protein [Candidatus Niyogibacteria bacterium]